MAQESRRNIDRALGVDYMKIHNEVDRKCTLPLLSFYILY